MIIELLPKAYSVCRLSRLLQQDMAQPFSFCAQTDEEISLVCPGDYNPAHVLQREDGWRMYRIAGSLDFSLVGIIAPIAQALAQAKISIFVVSTFNTDYFLVKSACVERTNALLKQLGYALQVQ